MSNYILVMREIRDKLESFYIEKENKIKQLTEEYEQITDGLERTYNTFCELNTACIYCEGTGKIRMREPGGCPNYPDYKTIICSQCGGTGEKQKE